MREATLEQKVEILTPDQKLVSAGKRQLDDLCMHEMIEAVYLASFGENGTDHTTTKYQEILNVFIQHFESLMHWNVSPKSLRQYAELFFNFTCDNKNYARLIELIDKINPPSLAEYP